MGVFSANTIDNTSCERLGFILHPKIDGTYVKTISFKGMFRGKFYINPLKTFIDIVFHSQSDIIYNVYTYRISDNFQKVEILGEYNIKYEDDLNILIQSITDDFKRDIKADLINRGMEEELVNSIIDYIK